SLLALNREHAATDVANAQSQGNVGGNDAQTYQDARDARDRWRTAGIVAFSVGAAALATGLVFYIFDRPMTLPPRARPEERKPSPIRPVEPTEMSMLPLVGPGFGGAALSGRF